MGGTGGVTRSDDGYFGGGRVRRVGWGWEGFVWFEGRLLSLCFTLREAYGWQSSFGRFAER